MEIGKGKRKGRKFSRVRSGGVTRSRSMLIQLQLLIVNDSAKDEIQGLRNVDAQYQRQV